MIDPQSLDLTSLPSVCLADRSLLPPTAGIYFAIDSLGTVQYIGKASGKDGLNGRWKSLIHHRCRQLQSIGGVKIAYMSIDTPELLPQIEKALIDWFDPPLNFSPTPERPTKRTRPTDRVNYKLDSEIRQLLSRIAERQGRNEGSQVEQLVLFFEACQRLNSEGVPVPFAEINAKVNEIWEELTHD
jgi:hypothetical protein